MTESTTKKVKEPLFHITKRASMPFWKAAGIRVLSVLAAVIICSVMSTILIGRNPFAIFGSFVKGIFIDPWTLLQDTALLLAFGLAIVPAFRMKYWNMGANGQVLMGCLAAIYCMINVPDEVPGGVVIIIMLLAAIAVSVIWAAIPAIFKALFNTNETLFTLMMNYIAIQLTSFAVSKWENPPGSNSIGTINSKGDVKYVGWIGNMFSDGYNKDFMWTVIIVLVLAALVYLYLKYTKHGYEIAVVGDSENTARYAGIRVPRIYVRTMALSGALCGFAGFLAVSAVSHTLSTSTAGGRGFTAIIVAWLAKMNPFVMILISALLSFLDKGAVQIASDFGLNEYVSKIISGVILFFILGSEFFINYQVKTGAKHK